MKRKRIDPPYKTYVVSVDGVKTPVDAHGIVIELAPEIELEIDLAPHPNARGGLPVHAGAERTLADFEKSGFCSTLLIRPGAANVIDLYVERRPWDPNSADNDVGDSDASSDSHAK